MKIEDRNARWKHMSEELWKGPKLSLSKLCKLKLLRNLMVTSEKG